MRLILLSALFLAGCSSVPVKPPFPEVPPRLMEKCPSLDAIHSDAKLSDVAKVVTKNYNTYYECAVKDDAWIEWYQIQKEIYDKIK